MYGERKVCALRNFAGKSTLARDSQSLDGSATNTATQCYDSTAMGLY